MIFYGRSRFALTDTLQSPLWFNLSLVGCKDRSQGSSEVSAQVPRPAPQDPEFEPEELFHQGEEVLDKFLACLVTGEGPLIDVENDLAGTNLATLRKLAAETMTPEGLPVNVITGERRVEGYFKVEDGILEKALPEKAKPFIIGVEHGEHTCSIAVNLDHWFTYYRDKDSFFLGFGTFKH